MVDRFVLLVLLTLTVVGGQDPDDEGDFHVDEEYFHRVPELNLMNDALHAQSVMLRKGPWCVSVEHDNNVGPRLLALLWFQYGSKVAYTAVRSSPPASSPPSDTPATINVNVHAHGPFTIHYVFVPGIRVGKEGVTMASCLCDEYQHFVELDGSHVDRLLTCVKDAGLPRCEWNRERNAGEGSELASWFTSPGGQPEDARDRFMTTQQAAPFLEVLPLADDAAAGQEVGRSFLASDWLTLRASRGCLRLWLYSWGRSPRAIVVYLQQQGSPLHEAVFHTMTIDSVHIIVWKEQLIPVQFTNFKIIVEFRGGVGWAGSMVMDDVSSPDRDCTDGVAADMMPGM
ncbi:uncharacterized protein LOC143279403 [Babylonia areolata]|uniref:uncharacterized protein LOC143279403 n=1 Tax=Babylonia areolata TaxID=304850 RepID=UPI003FD62877